MEEDEKPCRSPVLPARSGPGSLTMGRRERGGVVKVEMNFVVAAHKRTSEKPYAWGDFSYPCSFLQPT